MSYLELSPCGKYIAFMGEYGYIHILSTKVCFCVCSLFFNVCHHAQLTFFAKDGIAFVFSFTRTLVDSCSKRSNSLPLVFELGLCVLTKYLIAFNNEKL